MIPIPSNMLLMVPAHFHDVTHDKMKSNLIINIAGLHTLKPLLNQETPI